MTKSALSLALLFLITACTSQHGSFSALSPRPMSLYNLAANNETVAESVTNTQTRYFFLFIPFGNTPKVDNAAETLLQQYRGDYLTNTTITYDEFSFFGLWGHESWQVTGDVIRVPK